MDDLDNRHFNDILDEETCDEMLLSALYFAMSKPRNHSQQIFHAAWEAVLMIRGDGIEKLFEQTRPLETYTDALAEIGLPAAQQVLLRAVSLVPTPLRTSKDGALFKHIHSQFEEFKQLAYEFYDATADVDLRAAAYIREHRSDFTPFLTP
jgi:hypothetical protein